MVLYCTSCFAFALLASSNIRCCLNDDRKSEGGCFTVILTVLYFDTWTGVACLKRRATCEYSNQVTLKVDDDTSVHRTHRQIQYNLNLTKLRTTTLLAKNAESEILRLDGLRPQRYQSYQNKACPVHCEYRGCVCTFSCAQYCI